MFRSHMQLIACSPHRRAARVAWSLGAVVVYSAGAGMCGGDIDYLTTSAFMTTSLIVFAHFMGLLATFGVCGGARTVLRGAWTYQVIWLHVPWLVVIGFPVLAMIAEFMWQRTGGDTASAWPLIGLLGLWMVCCGFVGYRWLIGWRRTLLRLDMGAESAVMQVPGAACCVFLASVSCGFFGVVLAHMGAERALYALEAR
jgi:hypothetical protein